MDKEWEVKIWWTWGDLYQCNFNNKINFKTITWLHLHFTHIFHLDNHQDIWVHLVAGKWEWGIHWMLWDMGHKLWISTEITCNRLITLKTSFLHNNNNNNNNNSPLDQASNFQIQEHICLNKITGHLSIKNSQISNKIEGN